MDLLIHCGDGAEKFRNVDLLRHASRAIVIGASRVRWLAPSVQHPDNRPRSCVVTPAADLHAKLDRSIEEIEGPHLDFVSAVVIGLLGNVNGIATLRLSSGGQSHRSTNRYIFRYGTSSNKRAGISCPLVIHPGDGAIGLRKCNSGNRRCSGRCKGPSRWSTVRAIREVCSVLNPRVHREYISSVDRGNRL
jgi:hypothetical protein